MGNVFWWIRQVALMLLSGFFLLFGIQLLISSYALKDPFTFLMTFFASNFIILISATLMVGFAYRMVVVYRRSKRKNAS